MSPYPLLFSPLAINQLTLRNRIVMPAMHMNYTPGGKVSDQLVAFYAERAKGGAGLIIAGGCIINDLAGGPIFISIKDDSDIEGLSRLAAACHGHGAAIGAQLYMAGAYAHQALIGTQPVSSSPHTSGYTKSEARAMTLEEIAATQDDFARAALRAKKAGMDMVEILGSAGYLICQFLSPKINQRTDRYGGSLENRMRFGLETVAKVRSAVGPEFCVGIRIAGNDFLPGSHTNAEAGIFAQACIEAGVDMINVTGGWHETLVPQITAELPPGGFAYLARGVRQAVKANAPVAASNRFHSPHLAEAALARGDADLICLGRPLLADAEWPVKAQAGQARLIRRCVACNQGCFDNVGQGRPIGCMVNPRASREAKLPAAPSIAAQPKRLVVVGGGVAGAMAALTAAQRGHKVTLLEAADRLGGQPVWYAEAVEKPDFNSIPAWQAATLAELQVDVRLNTLADAESIAALNPDSVILATGAAPVAPPIPGVNLPQVCHAWQVLKGQILPQGRVVVIGGGAVGLETALNIARIGALTPEQLYYLSLFRAEAPEVMDRLIAQGSHQVTVVEMLPKVGQDIGRSTRWIVFGKLKRFGIKLTTKTQVLAIEQKGVRVKTEAGEDLLPANTVVIATGARPVNDLATALKAKGLTVIPIGDAAQGGTLLKAVAQGYQVGLEA